MSSPATTDAVVTLQTGDDRTTVMRGLLSASMFTDCLRRARGKSSARKEEFNVAVKVFVDYAAGENQVDYSVAPELVDLLADEIGRAGVSTIVVLVDRLEGAEGYISTLKKVNYTVA